MKRNWNGIWLSESKPATFFLRLVLVGAIACIFNLLNYSMNHGLIPYSIFLGFALSGTLIVGALFLVVQLIKHIIRARHSGAAAYLAYGCIFLLVLWSSGVTTKIFDQARWAWGSNRYLQSVAEDSCSGKDAFRSLSWGESGFAGNNYFARIFVFCRAVNPGFDHEQSKSSREEAWRQIILEQQNSNCLLNVVKLRHGIFIVRTRC
ncbi:MAG: hypothetical protein K0U74_13995 [Alphaproteobacteria bacterium]|nr:hypothetical protein [Alphaproteobacteria bacterium]